MELLKSRERGIEVKKGKFPLYLKVILFQLIFLLLHYLYDWFPNNLVAIFSGTDESVYQHLKIGFFSYILLTGIEYLFIKKSISSITQFIIARLFTNVYITWVMTVCFLISPLIFVKIHSIPGEIIFANVALLLTSFFSFTAERHVEKSKPDRWMIGVSIFLFLLVLVQFIVFTNRLPWFDLFAIPEGW